MGIVPIKFLATLWLWKGKGAWHFITIEQNESDLIKEMYMWPRKGFGSIPVKVTIGETSWKTSVFPQKEGTFLLPIKKVIRDMEKIKEGNVVQLTIEVVN